MPPWLTSAAQRGSTSESGTNGSWWAAGGSFGRCPVYRVSNSARRPRLSAASTAALKNRVAAWFAVPGVKRTGGGPSSRNRLKEGASSVCPWSSNRGNPVRRNEAGQSDCGTPNQSGKSPMTRCGEWIQSRNTRVTGGSAKLASPLVQTGYDPGIEHEAIDGPPDASLEPSRPARTVEARRIGGLCVVGSEDRRRKMNRRGRDSVYLFEDARRETERVSNEDGAARLMEPPEALVRGSQFGDDRFEHQLQPTPRVPDIRVSRDRVVLFDRGRLVKRQPCLPHDVGEGRR